MKKKLSGLQLRQLHRGCCGSGTLISSHDYLDLKKELNIVSANFRTSKRHGRVIDYYVRCANGDVYEESNIPIPE